MKITRIRISDFHQFKNLDLDLTYPKGHPKQGQPLDKVCFIGQSGTGKTTLLELLPVTTHNYPTNIIEKIGSNNLNNNLKITFSAGLSNEFSIDSQTGENTNGRIEWHWDNCKFNGEVAEYDFIIQEVFHKWQGEISSKPIYLPANLNYEIDGVETNQNLVNKKIIDFSKEKVSKVWGVILEKIQTYQEQELFIRQEISKVVEKSSSNVKAIQEALKKLENWKNVEFDPIKDIADNCLDPLLSKYKLRVKTEFDFKSKEDIGFIKIEDFEGNEIPHGLWSTGTKQVILSAMPLYLLKPKHTFILFDEPERSLYPDLQRTIVDYYTSLTEDCQFFYSTHSPIIASNFEPWEIVELKFNSDGKVYRELYYEGENHVENYKWNPKFMRWDDILQRIFDLENDGSLERKEKLDELATLNVKYKKLVKKGIDNSDEGIEILKNIEELSKKLSKWD
ncbi:MAG: hypothetical protein CFE22_14590 [Cytophagaceae bacterium BCCC1]|nr:MAG: hypothetical protein CFE22_14590 [Cytophagaceae bacterium BCCC1]